MRRSSSLRMVSRGRHQANAGADFDNVQSLTVSEAKILIDAVMAKRQEAMNGAEVPVTEYVVAMAMHSY